MLFAFVLMAVAGVAYYPLCVSENRRCDSAYGIPTTAIDAVDEADASLDMTVVAIAVLPAPRLPVSQNTLGAEKSSSQWSISRRTSSLVPGMQASTRPSGR